MSAGIDLALAMPDPDDCVKPGTKWGKLGKGGPYCQCARHVAVNRAHQRVRDRRRRGVHGHANRGSWQVGVNALDAGPVLRRLDDRGWLEPVDDVAAVDVPESYPFPEHAPLVRRVSRRGWATLHEVDVLCCTVLGVHPALVYGQAWHDLETGEPL